MSELRWSLLILGVVFFAALTAWELRRPRQAREPPGPPEPTRPPEPPLQLPEIHALGPLAGDSLPVVELLEEIETLPVLEPAAPAAYAAPPAAAQHMEYEFAEQTMPAADDEGSAMRAAPPAPDLPVLLPQLPELPAVPAPRVEWPPDEERRIMALRLVAAQPERFAGRSLRQALAAEGFVLGRFAIFHKADETQRAILSAASLTRPGTFDLHTMDSQHFGGLSLFAVLPGPLPPPQLFEELVTTARHLNERLCGVLQDEVGTPLTPARIASLREHLATEALS
jgi:cell division protein ZipA